MSTWVVLVPIKVHPNVLFNVQGYVVHNATPTSGNGVSPFFYDL